MSTCKQCESDGTFCDVPFENIEGDLCTAAAGGCGHGKLRHKRQLGPMGSEGGPYGLTGSQGPGPTGAQGPATNWYGLTGPQGPDPAVAVRELFKRAGVPHDERLYSNILKTVNTESTKYMDLLHVLTRRESGAAETLLLKFRAISYSASRKAISEDRMYVLDGPMMANGQSITAVSLAFDRRTGRVVCAKSFSRVDRAKARKEFHALSTVVSEWESPCLLGALDQVEIMSKVVLLMPYSGVPLSAMPLKENPMDDMFGMIICSVLASLHACHSCGITHNDVNPENICLGAQNPPMATLVDYGSATFEGTEVDKAKIRSHDEFACGDRKLIGTPRYDLLSLAGTLYFLHKQKHCKSPAKLSKWAETSHSKIARVILWCLQEKASAEIIFGRVVDLYWPDATSSSSSNSSSCSSSSSSCSSSSASANRSSNSHSGVITRDYILSLWPQRNPTPFALLAEYLSPFALAWLVIDYLGQFQ